MPVPRSAPVAMLAVVVAGCAAATPEPPAEVRDGVVAIVGTDDLRFEPEAVHADAGVVTIELACEPNANHNVVIDELDVQVAACAPGQTAQGTVELEPGSYTLVCTVPGHETTMRATLTVR